MGARQWDGCVEAARLTAPTIQACMAATCLGLLITKAFRYDVRDSGSLISLGA